MILESLETHTHSWTLQAVKKREALDKSDDRDHAQSLFTLDRNGTHRTDGRALFDMRQAPAANATANAIAAAEAALRTRQQNRIDTLVADANSKVVEADRTVLTSYCELNLGEFNIFDEFVRVFDTARSHFVFEVVTPQVKRYLNAARITAESAAHPVPLKWADYKNLLLQRMQDGAQSNDLLTHLLKPREDALPISLWTAERRSERNLLEKDGVSMSEETWLAYVLSFVSSQEKQTLKVPAEKDRVAYNNNAGYKLKDLESDIAKTDPSTFQRFRQAYCTDPLAKRIMAIHKALAIKKETASSSRKSRTPMSHLRQIPHPENDFRKKAKIRKARPPIRPIKNRQKVFLLKF